MSVCTWSNLSFSAPRIRLVTSVERLWPEKKRLTVERLQSISSASSACPPRKVPSTCRSVSARRQSDKSRVYDTPLYWTTADRRLSATLGGLAGHAVMKGDAPGPVNRKPGRSGTFWPGDEASSNVCE